MRHFAGDSFWSAYRKLPPQIRVMADKNFALLKVNPGHPSLRLKKVGHYWSVRIGLHYRAIATEAGGDLMWHWIGSHADYDAKI